jgi:putative transposase
VDLICQTIGVAKSAYYNRKREPKTAAEVKRQAERAEIKTVFEENKEEYGRIRLQKAMRDKGQPMSSWKVGQLMKEEGLVPKKCKKYKATTNSKHKYEVAENLLNQDFTAVKPNEKWCGDSTYIATDEGWLYSAGIIDLCDRTCVGLTFSSRHTGELMIKALTDAKREYRPKEGLIFHSDRGVQYASNDYKDKLKQYGMEQSMSRSGVPYDNAAMESFWATVKTGCVNGVRFKTRKEAIDTIFEYVFGFYNTRRYHTSLGLETPKRYRENLLKSA